MPESPTKGRLTDCPACATPLVYVTVHGHEGAKCSNDHEFTVYGACDGLYPRERGDVMHLPYDEFMRMLDVGAQLHNALVRYSEDGHEWVDGAPVPKTPSGPSRRFMGRLLRLCDSMGGRFTDRYGDENGNPLKRTADEMRTDGWVACD